MPYIWRHPTDEADAPAARISGKDLDIRQVRVASPGAVVKAASETASGGKRESEYDNMFRTLENAMLCPKAG